MSDQYYKLLLDESGKFQRFGKNDNPEYASIVGGLLLSENLGKTANQEWAKSVFKAVKASDKRFKTIGINPYHGMDETSPHNEAFICAFFDKLNSLDGVDIVSFKNATNNYPVDSDWTYLMVFVDGIIKILNDLLSQTSGNITLEVHYAYRQNQTEDNGLELNTNNQIKQLEYRKRLVEQLHWRLAELPSDVKNRIKYTLFNDSATSNYLLMLADAVCTGLRGGYFKNSNNKIPLSDETRRKIYSYPIRSYTVGENLKWRYILNQFAMNDVANAIDLWYRDDASLENHELSCFKDKFHQKLLTAIKGVNFNISSLYTSISTSLSTYIDLRRYNEALSFITRLENEFCLLLKENNLPFKRLLFDLYFFKLTIYSHMGDDRNSVAVIAAANDIRNNNTIFEVKDIPYITAYLHRTIEPLINIFNKSKALESVEKLIATEKEFIDLCSIINGLETRSSVLGRLYGTYSRIVAYFFADDEKAVALARERLDIALTCFGAEEKRDISRVHLNKCLLNMSTDNFAQALEELASALNCPNDINKIAKTISMLENNQYFIMNYVQLMSLYKENSTSMYKAFCDNFFMQSIKSMTEDYPKYAILLFYARYIKNANVNQAIKTYSEVEAIALKDIAKYPIYCAGLVARYERILIEKGRTRKALITSTYELLESFMANSNNKPKADSLKEEEQLATIKDFCDGVVII